MKHTAGIVTSRCVRAAAGAVLLAGLAPCAVGVAKGQEPVTGDYWAHDPSTMAADSGRHFVFRTSEGIMAKWSDDKSHWTYGGRVFPSGPPGWTTNAVPGFSGTFWAPDVAYFNGRYHLYYSCSTWGSQVSAIGLATTPSLRSPDWTDRGPVVQSWGGEPYNAIDPSVLVDDDGKVWMAFGSYWDGIHLVELDPLTGLRVSPTSPMTRLADNDRIEAACLFKRDGYYYLFVNHGSCCSGIDSTYHIKVGRGASVTGPFLDRDGIDLVGGGGTLVLESTGRFIGPGHAGIRPEGGEDWFTYHYYDAGNANEGEATLGLARLTWTVDEWPVVVNDWAAFYAFEADARDHGRRYDGVMKQTARVVSESGRGNVLSLDGTSGFASLPSPVANASTFTAWAKWNGGGNWQRFFDFGDGTGRYLFLTPRASSGRLRFAMTVDGKGNEQIIEAPTAFPAGNWCHVAVTLADTGTGCLYLNGEPVATNQHMTIRPWEIQARRNYVGKSQWPDPLFDGLIDSVRVYGRALPAEEIRDLALAHPALAHRYSFSEDAYDPVGRAHGTLHGGAAVAGGRLTLPGSPGDYLELPGGRVSGTTAATLEFWATFGTNEPWARVFDFGRSHAGVGEQFIFFSPHDGEGGNRMGMSTDTGGATLADARALDNRAVHVACVVDPAAPYAAVYIDGRLDRQHSQPLPGLIEISPERAYLGRSLFSADAWLNGTIDEFRIYAEGLGEEEILANWSAGPEGLALPATLHIQPSPGGTADLTWPAYALGFTPEASGDLSGLVTWHPVSATPRLADDRWHITDPVAYGQVMYRLRRMD